MLYYFLVTIYAVLNATLCTTDVIVSFTEKNSINDDKIIWSNILLMGILRLFMSYYFIMTVHWIYELKSIKHLLKFNIVCYTIWVWTIINTCTIHTNNNVLFAVLSTESIVFIILILSCIIFWCIR